MQVTLRDTVFIPPLATALAVFVFATCDTLWCAYGDELHNLWLFMTTTIVVKP